MIGQQKIIRSRVSRRIVGLFLVAALIPTLLLGALTYRSIQKSIFQQQEKELVEASRSYALAVFGRMMFARSVAAGLAEDDRKVAGFTSADVLFAQVTTVENSSSSNNFAGAAIPARAASHPYTTPNRAAVMPRLLVQPPGKQETAPAVSLVVANNASGNNALLAQLQPAYLWGDRDDISSAYNICAYAADGIRLYCGYPAEAPVRLIGNNNVPGAWNLFLKPEFGATQWTFVSTRRFPAKGAALSDFLEVYVAVAASSVLLIILLSLVQIRRTMVPLERLIAGARRIAVGDFGTVDVRSQDEFGELASAVNSMSTQIKGQLTTLQTLAAIDSEMLRHLSLHEVMAMVGNAMRRLAPEATLHVAHCADEEDSPGRLFTQASDSSLMTEKVIPLLPADIAAHGRDDPHHADARPAFLPAVKPGWQSWHSGLMWQGEQYGLLWLEWPATLPLSRQAEDELVELCNRVAILIQLHQREQRLLYQARFDSLTGLLNRRGLEAEMAALTAASRPWAILFIDIDRFKWVNDTLGHKVGDLLLKGIAERLRHCAANGVAARLGGDEFLLLLPMDDTSEAVPAATRNLMHALTRPFAIASQSLQVTCSIGIAQHPSEIKDGHTLIERADIAMYRAKQLGRNNFQFYDAELDAESQARMQLEADLRLALEREEFVLHYQPKVDPHTGRIGSAEALVRWRHPTQGMVPPMRFISLAEETGLIVPLGAWVMRAACRQNMAWRRMGLGPLRIAVNVSARQFVAPDFVDSVASVLQDTGLAPDALEIELTESMVMNDVSNAIEVMSAVRALGVQLSIDDFGTGYSSLAYLKRFPISVLKVDQSFVRDLDNDEDSKMIVVSIIGLAHNLKLKVVAEGVETESQFDYLRGLGCDEIQGYYFSRPLDAPAFATFLERHENRLPRLLAD
jgi:diguanylate cyclase (GGDEF)-like protein